MAPSAAFITAQVADMTAAPLAEEFGGQQCEQSLQRRNLLRAGQRGPADGLGQVEVGHQGKEQEETGDLSGELPSVFEGQRPDIGEVGHEGTVVGVSTRLPQGTTLASRGQAGAAQDPEEIRFADVEPFALERGVNVCQGGSLAAEFAGPLVDGITFGGCLGAGPGGGEERADVGVACEVADDRTNGTDTELKPLRLCRRLSLRGSKSDKSRRNGRQPGSGCRWPQVFHTQAIRLRPMTLFNPVFNCVTPRS